MVKSISREQVCASIKLKDDVVLVEAFPEKYYNDAHLPGAIQMDYSEVGEKAEKLIIDKDVKIVVYCASTECQNSTKASRHLDSLGYKNVYEYVEGKQDWIEAGLPVETN